jgi:hypothetical protein
MDKAELRACLEQADAKEAGALLRAALRNKMREALMEIYEEEVQGLCGPSHSRDSKSDYYRAGSSPAKVKLGEHEHTIRRSRVRKSLGDASAEKHLATWKAARDPEAWEESLFRAVLCGVSTRSCAEAARKRAEGAFQKRCQPIVGEKGQDSYRRDPGARSFRTRYPGGDARRDLPLRRAVQRGCNRNRSKRHQACAGL